jgi:hypothetical protein
MAISVNQQPSTVSLSQSPIVVSFKETSDAITSSSFQYMLDLYYWSGSQSDSGSTSDYTLVKYPNNDNSGIFEVSRIMNSELNTLLAQAPTDQNTKWFKTRLYWQYQEGNTFVTSSGVFYPTGSQPYIALDGYNLFPEQINAPIASSTYTNFGYNTWPLMTDGPLTQSVFIGDTGFAGIFVGNSGSGTQPTKVLYRSSTGATANYNTTGNSSSNGQLKQYPIGPSETGFPLSTIGLEWFTVEPTDGFITLGDSIKYQIKCEQKYPNIRIKWKNRYGQFDYFNFDMVSKQSFDVNRSQYQPQIGTWNSNTLSYNSYDSSIINYLVDTKQSISVNSDWVSQDYNDIFKQFLVSDEMYWINNPTSPNSLTPITIKTETIQFKTGVVDKVIQYAFEFDFGQGYKLII